MNRREILAGLASTALVVGFDRAARRFRGERDAGRHRV